MNYGEFQQDCASRGFTETPLSLSQWLSAHRQLGDDDSVMDVALCVASGLSFPESVTLAVRTHLDSVCESIKEI